MATGQPLFKFFRPGPYFRLTASRPVACPRRSVDRIADKCSAASAHRDKCTARSCRRPRLQPKIAFSRLPPFIGLILKGRNGSP